MYLKCSECMKIMALTKLPTGVCNNFDLECDWPWWIRNETVNHVGSFFILDPHGLQKYRVM